jgi:prepilin-type N-terminal cleavage/methylation domain-containing protein
MKKKGFTLIELLVVIAIVALLLGILVPALNKARQAARKLVCGTHLKGMGAAMLTYASEFDDEFPRAGVGTTWSTDGIIGGLWDKPDRVDAFNRGVATITSSLYLLIKFTKATPGLFVCQGDKDVQEFSLSKVRTREKNLLVVWDFGSGGRDPRTGVQYPYPGSFCSYSYHMPYDELETGETYRILDVFNPGTPVCADRNPFLDKNVVEPKVGDNAETHEGRGQNVLFKDGSVDFSMVPTCGLKDDNIYTYGGEKELGGGTPEGTAPAGDGIGAPQGPKDAYLVIEWNGRGA